MDASRETLRQCADLGFAACRWPALKAFSEAIFAGVKAEAPDSSAWIIGQAMVRSVGQGDAEAGCQLMRDQGISRDSGDLLARAFLGLFLAMAKRAHEAEQVVRAVIEDGGDAEAASLAQAVLDNDVRR